MLMSYVLFEWCIALFLSQTKALHERLFVFSSQQQGYYIKQNNCLFFFFCTIFVLFCLHFIWYTELTMRCKRMSIDLDTSGKKNEKNNIYGIIKVYIKNNDAFFTVKIKKRKKII